MSRAKALGRRVGKTAVVLLISAPLRGVLFWLGPKVALGDFQAIWAKTAIFGGVGQVCLAHGRMEQRRGLHCCGVGNRLAKESGI